MKLFLILGLGIFSSLTFAQDQGAVVPVEGVTVNTVEVAPKEIPQVIVSEPAAPPKWAEEILVKAQDFPVVGPYVAKGIYYAGVVSSLLTALVAFLLAALKALSGVLSVAGAASFSEKIKALQDSKLMFWLKYFSMFNAKKPEKKFPTGSIV